MEDLLFMARRKKEVLTLEEQLEAVEKEIAECTARAKELNAQKKDINKQIAEENKKKLYDAVEKSGLSVDECIEIIAGHAHKSAEAE